MLNLKTVFSDTLKQIISNEQEWKKFLKFSGQIFKYNFYDTILIYNQRPDATIVAIELGGNILGNLQRIDNALENIESTVKRYENQLVQLNQDFETAKEEYDKPWRFDEEYKAKLERQAELNVELDLNKRDEVIGYESSVYNKTSTNENKDNAVETDKEADEEEQDMEI